ncbi:3-deoxy-manno-octulosonate cytidylyltransferase [Nocardioides sp.]
MLSSELHVVIPARFGSTRLPGKPLINLGGKPMIARVFDSVAEALPGRHIIIATDDSRIVKVLQEHHLPYVLTDPALSSGTDRIAEVGRVLDWPVSDVVVNIQGDEPLLPQSLLRGFVDMVVKDPTREMSTVAVPASLEEVHDPNTVKVTVRADGRATTFSRAPVPYERDRRAGLWAVGNHLRHLGIYAYRHDVLQTLTAHPPSPDERLEKLEQLRALWLGVDIQVMIWPESPPAGVDSPDDARRVAAYFAAERE